MYSLIRAPLLFLIILVSTPVLFPQQSVVSKGVNAISAYIASDYFRQMQYKCSDLQRMDSLYTYAVNFYNGNIDEALLALTFATVPYKKVPVQIPIIKAILYYPLISADDSTFEAKNNNLPRYFYFDSPQDNYGDKDKCAHFFGSSYIAYSSNIFELGNLIGYFVEVFEENFKVQSSIDIRDMSTNSLGNIFGKTVKKNKNAMPSGAMLIPFLRNLKLTL